MIPDRVKPDPIPIIRPVWEYQAEGELRGMYEAYKRAFQVPWVGVVSMAYAHYKAFFAAWWEAFEPIVQSAAYVASCKDLLGRVERSVAILNPPPITERLRDLGYSTRELNEIYDMIEVFSHGNFIQLPAVVAARLLLEGGQLNGSEVVEPYRGYHAPVQSVPFVLMEPHHAMPDTQALYRDIMDTLDLPFVNTDYRALARWPSYLELAWSDLRPVLRGEVYREITGEMHKAMFKAAANLPNPTGLTALRLQEAAARDARIADVLEMTRLFTYLLPGLVTHVAYFRAQFSSGKRG